MIDNADGTPRAMHPFGGWIYLPHTDKVFLRGEGNFQDNPAELNPWILDLSKVGITAGNPWTKGAISGNDSGSGLSCALDTTVNYDSVICIIGNAQLWRYTPPPTDTWTALNNFGDTILQQGSGGTLAIDPKRKYLFDIGSDYSRLNPKIYMIDMTQPFPWTAVDWTSSVTGCGDLIGYAGPSVAWDDAINKFVAYIPTTVASFPASVNEILIFDSATRTCTVQPQLGGSGPLASSPIAGGQDMYAKWSYVPALDEFVLINDPTQDAWTFKLGATAPNGLGNGLSGGHPYTCVDRDGDTYGVGPDCAGPDADDLDANVHTMAQACNVWNATTCGTPTNAQIKTVLNHLGYAPTNIWYVATTGTDATTQANRPDLPAATCCGTGKANPAAGDAVLIRGGSYTQFINQPAGSAGSPVIVMAYPGELPSFSGVGNGVDCKSFNIIDGIKVVGTLLNNGGVNCANASNVEIRHLDSSANKWQVVASNSTGVAMADLTVEDSAIHDNWSLGCGTAEHGIYISNHQDQTAHQSSILDKNIFVWRNLMFKNCSNGVQFNGRFSNIRAEQNISYSNGIGGFALLSGVQASTFRDNLAFNNAQASLNFFGYGDFCIAYDPTQVGSACPYQQTGNVIENNTFYSTGHDPTSGGASTSFAAISMGNTQNYAIATTSSPTAIAASGAITFTIASWSNASTYNLSDIVAYSGTLYASLTSSNTGNQPNLNPSLWQPLVATSAALWTNGQRVRVCPPQGGSTPCLNTVDTANSMEGAVQSYTFPTLVVTMDTARGSGSFSTWQVNMAQAGSQGSNTFRNNILLSDSLGSGGFGATPIRYDEAGYVTTSNYNNNLFCNLTAPACSITNVIQTTSNSGGAYVINYFTCAQAQAGSGTTFGSFTNCQNGDPKFTSASTSFWNSPGSFDFRLATGSPAIAAATTSASAPAFDVRGSLLAASGTPDLGGLQTICQITPTSLGPWTLTQSYSTGFSEIGCTPSLTWSSTGTWPGVVFSGGATASIAGTVSGGAGTYTPSVSYDTATNNYSILVNAVPSVSQCGGDAPPACPNVTQGAVYSQSVTIANGTGVSTCSVTAGSLLGSGVSLSSGCSLSGTAANPGTYNFTVTPRDGNNVAGAGVPLTLAVASNVPQGGSKANGKGHAAGKVVIH